jgi:hypothetical protein
MDILKAFKGPSSKELDMTAIPILVRAVVVGMMARPLESEGKLLQWRHG